MFLLCYVVLCLYVMKMKQIIIITSINLKAPEAIPFPLFLCVLLKGLIICFSFFIFISSAGCLVCRLQRNPIRLICDYNVYG